MSRAEVNTSWTTGNATMEKCECLHHGRYLEWQGQSRAEEGLSPTWPLLPQPQESQLSMSSAPGLGLGPAVEPDVGPKTPFSRGQ